ncbi:MAG: hypothetical protein WC337_06405 [Candidatus Muiribacteriota bacterium]
MKRFTKVTSLLLVAVMLTLVFAGCGGSKTTPLPPVERITSTIQGAFDSGVLSGAPHKSGAADVVEIGYYVAGVWQQVDQTTLEGKILLLQTLKFLSITEKILL